MEGSVKEQFETRPNCFRSRHLNREIKMMKFWFRNNKRSLYMKTNYWSKFTSINWSRQLRCIHHWDHKNSTGVYMQAKLPHTDFGTDASGVSLLHPALGCEWDNYTPEGSESALTHRLTTQSVTIAIIYIFSTGLSLMENDCVLCLLPPTATSNTQSTGHV